MLLLAVFQAGDYLDAQDHQLLWFDSRVLEVQPAFSIADALPAEFRRKAEETLRIHFMGWDSKYDTWFLRSSPKLQPLFTKVRSWRDFRVNDKIEMRVSRPSRWFVVRVEEVDRVGYRILVRSVDEIQRTVLGDRWFDFMRYELLHRRILGLRPPACLLDFNMLHCSCAVMTLLLQIHTCQCVIKMTVSSQSLMQSWVTTDFLHYYCFV